MKLNSIRVKTLLILIPLVILPILLVGVAGTLFYRDVIRQNIWDDNLAQAKALAAFEGTSINYSTLYLKSLASRPLVVNDLQSNTTSVLNITLEFASVNTDFNSLFVTDRSGIIVASYPNAWLLGNNSRDRPYVNRALQNSDYVGAPMLNETGEPVVYISVPVTDQNGTLLGAVVGEIDTDILAKAFFDTLVKNQQYAYMVNGSGNIIIHSNRSYMVSMMDYSPVPAVRDVIKGNEGVAEQFNPIEHEQRLAAYAPVNDVGWGIVISVPVDVAYQPIYRATYLLAAAMLALMIITALIAYLFGNYIVGPIVGVSTATKKMTNGGDYHRYLPLDRKDEIGELARSFDDMSRRIGADKERITEEKNRTELYVDIMGHDINNLNQSALANLELIEDDPNLTDDERKSIRDALAAVRGSAGIIDNVRKIQRINDEQIDVVPEDLDALIEACIKDMPRPQDKKVVINYNPKPGLLVRGNPLLKEAFCNLIGNAIKYSGDEATIDIRVKRIDRAAEPFYEVVIEDNGHGIPDDLKPKLFQRFRRGTTKAHGKGLGLYIVRSLVEKLGGSVRVEDRVPGDYAKGAKFVVTLPAYKGGEVDR
jgi:two-component system, sensor histidine kinase